MQHWGRCMTCAEIFHVGQIEEVPAWMVYLPDWGFLDLRDVLLGLLAGEVSVWLTLYDEEHSPAKSFEQNTNSYRCIFMLLTLQSSIVNLIHSFSSVNNGCQTIRSLECAS